MNFEYFLEETNLALEQFKTIGLQDMERVKLMNRVDVKFVIPLHLLSEIIKECQPFYQLLEINDDSICSYETLYYDTSDLTLYHQHHTGRLNRYKVRFRNYVGSNLSFFEIKHKTNKGRTIKTRIVQPNNANINLNSDASEFLEKSTPFNSSEMKGNIWVNYQRITLVNKTSNERLTIDINLTFKNGENTVRYNQVAIAEVKQERFGASPIIDIFKKYNLRPGSISKYCLGILSIFEEVKINRFKRKLLYFKKIKNQYDVFTRIS